jgi:hypothetical protein
MFYSRMPDFTKDNLKYIFISSFAIKKLKSFSKSIITRREKLSKTSRGQYLDGWSPGKPLPVYCFIAWFQCNTSHLYSVV